MGGGHLNYIDIRDVLSHDMLVGVITAIDAVEDTCTVDVDGRTLEDIPLFFNGGSNTIPNELPSGHSSIIGASLDFEVEDSVIVMIGRDIYTTENFVLGQTSGKKLRYYLVDFKRINDLDPGPYYNLTWLPHYAPDKVEIIPLWSADNVLSTHSVIDLPDLGSSVSRELWYITHNLEYTQAYSLPDIPIIDYLILLIMPTMDYYFNDYPMISDWPYRPIPTNQEYTFSCEVEVYGSEIPQYIRADWGYWDYTTSPPEFVSLSVIKSPETLDVGSNIITFDFMIEDLYSGSLIRGLEYVLGLWVQVYFTATGGYVAGHDWKVYSILEKV